MNLPKNALVAVVDGERLALFRNTSAGEPELSAVDTPEINAHGAGTGGHRSGASNPDNDTQAEDGFATGVADLLNGWAATNKFDKILVVAAPKTMGELRQQWSKPFTERLCGEITKELTGRTGHEIAKAIAAA